MLQSPSLEALKRCVDVVFGDIFALLSSEHSSALPDLRKRGLFQPKQFSVSMINTADKHGKQIISF